MARRRPGATAAPPGDVKSISVVAAALAVAAAQPVDTEATDWVVQVVYLLREAQGRCGPGENGMGVLQELFTRRLSNLDANTGGSGP